MNSNLSKTCRACLKENGADIMFPLAEADLQKIYFICTSIEIPADDKGPHLLCNLCRCKCLRLHKFKLQALASEKKIFGGRPLAAVEAEEEELAKSDLSAHQNDTTETPNTSMVEVSSVTQTPIKEEKVDNDAQDMAKDNNEEALDVPPQPAPRKYYRGRGFSNVPPRQSSKRKTASIYKFPREVNSTPQEGTTLNTKKKKAIEWKNNPKAFPVNPDIPFHCPLCNVAFTTFHLFKTHFELEHENDVLPVRINDPKPWQKLCLTCGIQMGPKETLLSHTVLRHMQKDLYVAHKSFKCKICPELFSLRRQRDVHQQIHNKKWQCQYCEIILTQRKLLKEHIRTHHVSFKCDHCGHDFDTIQKLDQHMWVHSHKRPYFCKICQQTFSVLAYARLHISSVHSTHKYKLQVHNPLGRTDPLEHFSPDVNSQAMHTAITGLGASPQGLPMMREGQPMFRAATETKDDDDDYDDEDDIMDKLVDEMTSEEDGF